MTHDNDFVIQQRTYDRQYACMYQPRLTHLRPILIEKAKALWESLPETPTYVSKVLDVPPEGHCYIVGTVYMESTKKPNVMSDLDEEASLVAPTLASSYRTDQRTLFLEDESGRVELSGDFIKNEFLVSGIVIAAMGTETRTGTFAVSRMCLPGLAPQTPLEKKEEGPAKYVAFVSGLDISADVEDRFNSQLLTQFLSGELANSEFRGSGATIERLLIVGKSIYTLESVCDGEEKNKKYGYEASRFNRDAIQVLDALLVDLCAHTKVNLMPGPNDPTSNHLPQRPVVPFIFSKAHTSPNLISVTNPYCCEIDNVMLLGTSGQNIDDIGRYVEIEDRLIMAEHTLQWQHIIPTAPDTLWCYPFDNVDPFLMKQSPHVYFIGNQPKFQTNELQGANGQSVRVIMIPSFSKTGQVVLMNLGTLECKVISCGGEAMDESL